MTPLPAGRFGAVVIDPPWAFSNKASRAAATNHYGTMGQSEIRNLAVDLQDHLAPQAHVYLWTTDAHLMEALHLLAIMGADYKQTLVWVKSKSSTTTFSCAPARRCFVYTENGHAAVQIGLGNYFRHSHELCLFATKGKAKATRHDLPSVFFAARGKHSAKPEILQDLAEAQSPGPYLELFARRSRPGWRAWGLQAPESEAA